MSELLITNTEAGTLIFYEADNIPYINDITTRLNSGTYIKLTNKEFIFEDYSQVASSQNITIPQNQGYMATNKTIMNLEFSYDEE